MEKGLQLTLADDVNNISVFWAMPAKHLIAE
jgi:hypothetical protein